MSDERVDLSAFVPIEKAGHFHDPLFCKKCHMDVEAFRPELEELLVLRAENERLSQPDWPRTAHLLLLAGLADDLGSWVGQAEHLSDCHYSENRMQLVPCSCGRDDLRYRHSRSLTTPPEQEGT